MNLLATVAPWQLLLNGFGWCLAEIYSVVPNYALAIIILTVLIRLLLLPFGFKQIKSMQHMQALQPELKQLQKKYKNNKQKLQEEQMQLYREAGVNPLGGCLPLLLTLPFLFAMYAVIRPPVLEPNATQVVPVTAAAVASGNVAQFTLSEPTSLKDGDVVIVSGMTPGDYNGEWTVSSVSGATFQADIGGTPPAATGFGSVGPRDSYIRRDPPEPRDALRQPPVFARDVRNDRAAERRAQAADPARRSDPHQRRAADRE